MTTPKPATLIAPSQGARTPTISIITVTYNSRAEIQRFLESLSEITLTFSLDLETRIWDNDSKDGTGEYLSSSSNRFPHLRIKVTLNPRNVGLSAALNSEIAKSSSDYILSCNPDVIFTDGLIHLLELSRKYPECGLVPEMYNLDGTIQRTTYKKYPTAIRLLVDYTTFGQYFTKYVSKRIHDDYGYIGHKFGRPVDGIEQPGGGFMLLHRKTIAKIGFPFYDESFPIYWNDVDLAFRARRKGVRFLIAPEAKIYHTRFHTAKSLSWPRACLLFYSSLGMMGFLRKWSMKPRLLQMLFFLDCVVSFPPYARKRGLRGATQICVAKSRSLFL